MFPQYPPFTPRVPTRSSSVSHQTFEHIFHLPYVLHVPPRFLLCSNQPNNVWGRVQIKMSSLCCLHSHIICFLTTRELVFTLRYNGFCLRFCRITRLRPTLELFAPRSTNKPKIYSSLVGSTSRLLQ